ncbi:hypothetical protein ACFV4P_34455 [Kitasatospora sp. NPDC059795]|uniref:hypothetical protein n=1 Tax=Kitasatospora sp. NPDC059795 TaxID=3346949 RepID=UPI0036461FBA
MAKMPRKVRNITDRAVQITTGAIALAVLLWAPIDGNNRGVLAATVAGSALLAHLGLRAAISALWSRLNRRPTVRRARA